MTKPITDAELDEWERIEKAATPGPWFRLEGCGGGVASENGNIVFYDEGHDESDEELTVKARNAFPRLLSENRKLRAHIINTAGEDAFHDLLRED